MGNRGSKSEFRISQPKRISVKEQRVDGSWFLANKAISLRCTLMGFERYYQVKVLSKRLCKQVSTLTSSAQPLKFSLNPWFVTGLIDAEGVFSISFRKDKEYKLGWQIGAEFQIQLHKKDINILLELQKFFSGTGSISISKTRQRATYSVKSIKDIVNTIIPHFLKYNLLTQKAADFSLFTEIVELLNAKGHLTSEGLNKVVNLKASLNLGISEVLKSYFTNIIPVERPLVKSTSLPDPNWIAGFVSGEGCFDINLKNSTSHRTGYQVILRFSVKQHERDKYLMGQISKWLGCGKVYQSSGYNCCSLTVVKYSEITNLIIPFFKKYPVLGVKQYDFSDWCKVANLMKEGYHLTEEGLKLIQSLKNGMNKNRSSE